MLFYQKYALKLEKSCLLTREPAFSTDSKNKPVQNIYLAIQRETKTIEVSVDVEDKLFLTLTNSYILIVRLIIFILLYFYLDFNHNNCQ